MRVCAADVPMPYATNLEALATPQVDEIVHAAKKFVIDKRKNKNMPVNILMPALSPTMTDGTLSKRLKQEGDDVKAGDDRRD